MEKSFGSNKEQKKPLLSEEYFNKGMFASAFFGLFIEYFKKFPPNPNQLFNNSIRLVNLLRFRLGIGNKPVNFRTVMTPLKLDNHNHWLWRLDTMSPLDKNGRLMGESFLSTQYVSAQNPDVVSTTRVGYRYHKARELIVVVVDGFGGLSLTRSPDHKNPGKFGYGYNFNFLNYYKF